MIIKNKNFSRGRLADFNPSVGDVIESCNLSQMYPHTEITQVDNLTFTKCNLVNCDVPVSATINGGNTRQVSKCGHLHADCNSCIDQCEHMISEEEVSVDGVIVTYLREYEDKYL